MGSVMFRNRYWFYKSLYDDYIGREFRLSFGLSCLIWLPHYWYGIHLNRTIEEGAAHKNYFVEWNPRRNRLTHNLIFEEFEMVLENWVKLEQEYQESTCCLTQVVAKWLNSNNDPINNQKLSFFLELSII